MKQSKLTNFYELNCKKFYKKKQLNKLTQLKITNFYCKKIYGYNYITDSWHCTICGVDMGKNNPRQLCGKYYCDNL